MLVNPAGTHYPVPTILSGCFPQWAERGILEVESLVQEHETPTPVGLFDLELATNTPTFRPPRHPRILCRLVTFRLDMLYDQNIYFPD